MNIVAGVDTDVFNIFPSAYPLGTYRVIQITFSLDIEKTKRKKNRLIIYTAKAFCLNIYKFANT